MTPEEAVRELKVAACPPAAYADPFYRKFINECEDQLLDLISVFRIFLKNTTIDCMQPIKEQIYVVSIRSKITKQIEYQEVIEFLKKYNKEEYEKCLNIFTSK